MAERIPTNIPASEMTNRKAWKELLKNKDFLNQNLQSFGVDQNTLPFGPAGVLRRVVGGGMLSGPSRVGATSGTSVGFPKGTPGSRRTIPGSATTVPGSPKSLPAPRGGKLGHLLTLLTMGGYGAYNLLKDNQDTPVDVANEVPIVDPRVDDVGAGGVVPAPTDSWQPPGGLQTGLDFIKDRRNFYYESMSGALGKAAILNLMEKGAGDSYLKDIQGDIEQEEVYKDDEYLAKINKAIFSKPYKNSKEIFDRLVKAQIPVDIASKITGYVPKTKMVNFINPDTEETYTAAEDSIPREGFRRVDPTLDKSSTTRTYETSEVLSEAVKIGGLQGAEFLARFLYTKGGRGVDYTYEQALEAATEMMKAGKGSAPKTREEAFAILKNDPAWSDKTDEEINAALDARWGS